MGKKIKFFSSIHFKIALVFTLTLVVTLELIGAFFIRQLEQRSLADFRQQIALPAYASDAILQQLESKSEKTGEVNSNIHNLLTSINNASIADIKVVDAEGVIRGTSDINNQDEVGQKTTDSNLKAVISGGKYLKNPIEKRGNNRYQTIISPLVSSVDGENNVIGVIKVSANLESVYDNLHGIAMIYFSASMLAVVLGIIMAVIISRALTKPISEISQRTTRIAQGDYSGEILVRSSDEIGELAENVNLLAQRIEETTNSSEFERRRLDSVLEHMTDGVIATDRRGLINIINPAAVNLAGFDSAHQVIEKSILDVLHLGDSMTLRELLDNQGDLLIDFTNDKRQLVIRAYISTIQRASGFISGLVIVLHDVTEQQRIDEERRQFVSNVSHELRTPLTSVKSYIDALQEGALEDPEIATSFLAVAQNETTRMIHMINDLLELSRMDQGTMNMELEFVNLGELFNYILNRFDMIISTDQQPEKNYTIQREISPDQIWVELDTSKFTQVIDNIMNNAIKYSPDGSVINVMMEHTDSHVILSISDQGLGIPRKDLGHIFDRFYRVDKARSRAQGGSGLGLAISKEIIEQVHGNIWVDSVEGQGSTFYISLPFTPYEGNNDDWEEGAWDEV
ncbi:MAG: cell wall metabolism sensor histidine kinase WalK [Lactobacillaceae bacterium]|jgi:two-component system sensor histidine kinase VicK|nr:cell wall metabolism sensor histidine kinase WalK [Lactobacillaceae bacterium]